MAVGDGEGIRWLLDLFLNSVSICISHKLAYPALL